MKFKFLGEDNSFCMELIAFNIVPKGKFLMKGDVIDVPEDKERVIRSLNTSGLFQEVKVNQKAKKWEKK